MKFLHIMLSLFIVATSTTALAEASGMTDAGPDRMAHSADAGHDCCDTPEQPMQDDCCDNPTCGQCQLILWAFATSTPEAGFLAPAPAPLYVGPATANPHATPLLRPPIA